MNVLFDYSPLLQTIANTPLAPLAAVIPADLATNVTHGDFSKWQAALSVLPSLIPHDLDLHSALRVGTADQLNDSERAVLMHAL